MSSSNSRTATPSTTSRERSVESSSASRTLSLPPLTQQTPHLPPSSAHTTINSSSRSPNINTSTTRSSPSALSTPSSSTSSSSSSSTKKKRKKGSKKKKKKKPIVEEPKLVRDMVAAAQNNNLTELKTMFTNPDNHKKFDMNATAGETLVVSSVNGHSAVVEFLVSSGAFPNTQNGKALQRAALAQQKQTMQILLKYGADVNCRSAFAELTPLHYAAQTGNVSVVSLLVSHGAKVDLSSHPEHSGSECGWTALHFAADAGYVEVVRTLIGANCNLDARTAQDETAMTIAAEHGKWEVVKLLVVCGANIHATRRGLNVCEWAIYRAEADAVQFLVSYGAKPNLNARCLWFNPPHFTLKQICTRDFSEQVYEEIDLAIYRGGKQVKQRLEKRKLVSAVQWEHAPTFDPYSFDPLPPPTVCKFTDPIINLIIAYEM